MSSSSWCGRASRSWGPLLLRRASSSVENVHARKARELHAEMETLFERRARRETERANEPWGSWLRDLARTSRSELINVGAAFLCACLAFQVSGARRLVRRANEERTVLEKERNELEEIVRSIRDEAFVASVCAAIDDRRRATDDDARRERRSRWWGLFGATDGSGPSTNDPYEEDRVREYVGPILREEILRVVKEYGMTEAEKESKELETLETLTKIDEEHKPENSEASLNVLMSEIQSAAGSRSPTEGTDVVGAGETLAKKAKFVL